jgi:transketolase
MSTLPNINVWAPADGLDVEWMLRQIWREQKPAYIRLPRDPQRALGGAAAEFRWFGPPSQVVTVSSGLGTQWALEVKQLLVTIGLNMSVLHLPKIWPLSDAVCEALESAKYLFVIEDHSECGGLADLLRRNCPGKIIYSSAWPGNWPGASGAVADLRRHCGMDAESIMRRYLDVVDLARNESTMQTEVRR